MKGQQKQDFQELLGMIDQKTDELKVAFPEFQAACREKYEDLHQRHQENLKRQTQIQADLKEAKQKLKAGTGETPKQPVPKPASPTRGRKLQVEILSRFQPRTEQREDSNGAAWQDWNLEGDWVAVPSDPNRRSGLLGEPYMEDSQGNN
jgi:hypothetical protein